MKLTLSVVIAINSLFVAGACVNTAQDDAVEIVDFGIYNSNRTAPELIEMTDEIPAIVGTVFGIRVEAAGDQAGDYEFRWTFPEMQNPANGQVWTEMTGTRELKSDEPQSFLVRINNDWEAKAGNWTIQLERAGRVAAEKSFDVREPESKTE
ncbi:MAG: DUF3859 domain-containing protein [Woeseiaceae bacterium]|nr:DUF3859 domain-containing protein [Woeseiaceae bacterium]